MAIEHTLSAQKREGTGKGAAGRLRAQSLIPGVFYNAKGENINVQVPALALEQLYFKIGDTVCFNLEIDDNGTKTAYPCFFWEVKKHPYKKQFTHIDYYGVDLDKELTIVVPIVFTGVSKGVKLGGQLETYRENIRVCAKPLDMPKEIVVDITEMGLNDTITASTLPMPEGCRAVYNNNFRIISVISKEKEETPAEEK